MANLLQDRSEVGGSCGRGVGRREDAEPVRHRRSAIQHLAKVRRLAARHRECAPVQRAKRGDQHLVAGGRRMVRDMNGLKCHGLCSLLILQLYADAPALSVVAEATCSFDSFGRPGHGSVWGLVGMFSRTTPAMMRPMPAICQRTNVSPKTKTPTIAVSAVPTPDQVA